MKIGSEIKIILLLMQAKSCDQSIKSVTSALSVLGVSSQEAGILLREVGV